MNRLRRRAAPPHRPANVFLILYLLEIHRVGVHSHAGAADWSPPPKFKGPARRLFAGCLDVMKLLVCSFKFSQIVGMNNKTFMFSSGERLNLNIGLTPLACCAAVYLQRPTT